MMTHDIPGEYVRQTILTASPEQLQLMLYDGAIRFARQGREALAARDFETSCEKLLRAQRVVVAMQNGLRKEVNPALCEQLASLYDFIYWRLVDANTRHDVSAIDDALRILEHQRETWRLLVEKTRAAADGAPGETAAEGDARISVQC